MRDLPAVPEDLRAWQRLVHAALQCYALVAILGFARCHLNHDHRWRPPLNEAVFPVYLLRQTLIIVLAMAAMPRVLHPAVEGVMPVSLTFALALGARRLRHAGPLRPWFGLPRRGGRG